MTWKRAVGLASAAAVVATGTLAGVVNAPALASVPVTIPFRADSGETSTKACGFTEGSFQFRDDSAGGGAWPISGALNVKVDGVVVDRAFSELCGPSATPSAVVQKDATEDEGRITVATFTTTVAEPGVPVTVSYQVDNGSLGLSFQPPVRHRVEQISVQVCRIPLPGHKADSYCGQPVLITAPPPRG
jgi:hypothetical protein